MEPMGANALALEGVVLYPTAFPRTRERLERLGLPVRSIDVGELQKAEGGSDLLLTGLFTLGASTRRYRGRRRKSLAPPQSVPCSWSKKIALIGPDVF